MNANGIFILSSLLYAYVNAIDKAEFITFSGYRMESDVIASFSVKKKRHSMRSHM